MCEPPLVHYSSEQEYRTHFEQKYCSGFISTFDGYSVRIFPNHFNHCMFESANRRAKDKSNFSMVRALRVDWIQATIADPNADLYQGWDSYHGAYDPNTRVAHAFDDYVVIIRFSKVRAGFWVADFVTAYVAETNIGLIITSPKWDIKNCR
jgi:hypothetical protein